MTSKSHKTGRETTWPHTQSNPMSANFINKSARRYHAAAAK
jgi:hypothetical protein